MELDVTLWNWLGGLIAGIIMTIVGVVLKNYGRRRAGDITESTDAKRRTWAVERAGVFQRIQQIEEEVTSLRASRHEASDQLHTILAKLELMDEGIRDRIGDLKERVNRIEEWFRGNANA